MAMRGVSLEKKLENSKSAFYNQIIRPMELCLQRVDDLCDGSNKQPIKNELSKLRTLAQKLSDHTSGDLTRTDIDGLQEVLHTLEHGTKNILKDFFDDPQEYAPIINEVKALIKYKILPLDNSLEDMSKFERSESGLSQSHSTQSKLPPNQTFVQWDKDPATVYDTYLYGNKDAKQAQLANSATFFATRSSVRLMEEDAATLVRKINVWLDKISKKQIKEGGSEVEYLFNAIQTLNGLFENFKEVASDGTISDKDFGSLQKRFEDSAKLVAVRIQIPEIQEESNLKTDGGFVVDRLNSLAEETLKLNSQKSRCIIS